MKRIAVCVALTLLAGPAFAQQSQPPESIQGQGAAQSGNAAQFENQPQLNDQQQSGRQSGREQSGQQQLGTGSGAAAGNQAGFGPGSQPGEPQGEPSGTQGQGPGGSAAMTQQGETSSNQARAPGASSAKQQVQQAQQVLWLVSQAEDAIDSGHDAKADKLLNQAASTLRTIASEAPGSEVLRRLDRISRRVASGESKLQAGGTGSASATSSTQTAQTASNASGNRKGPASNADFAPLMEAVSEHATFLDPRVAAGVASARQEAQQGNAQGSMRNLQLAREHLVADVALLPIEGAYARVVAARADLKAGNRESAVSLLNGIPVVITQVQVGAPLVPARFDLRAAADAANTGHWKRAGELAADAAVHLQSAEEVSPQQLSPKLTNLADRATQLHEEIASGQRPNPSVFRQLADETQSIARQAG